MISQNLAERVIRYLELPGIARLNLWSDEIVELVWSEHLEELNKAHFERIIEGLGQLGEGKKMLLLVRTRDFLSLSPEGGKFAGSPEAQKYTLKNAVEIRNMAQRIVYNFFMYMWRPAAPTRAFDNVEAARKWLKSDQNA